MMRLPVAPGTKFCTRVRAVLRVGKIQNFPNLYGEYIVRGKHARQSSLVDTDYAMYIIPLQN